MEYLKLTDSQYDGNTLRICSLPDGRKAVSIYDAITIAIETKNPHKAFIDVQKSHPEVLSISSQFGQKCNDFHQHKFPGQGQRLTPVATARGIMRIMMLLPGSKAAAFRNKAAETILKVLGGSESLIEEIRANAAIAQSDPNSFQAFAAEEVSREKAIDDRKNFVAEVRRLELENDRMEAENREMEISFLNNSRSYLEQIKDPRLVQTLTDSINNQLSSILSGGK